MNYRNQGHYDSMAQGFMSKVYGWLCAGLAVTAAVSYYLSPDVNPAIYKSLVTSMPLLVGVLIASIGIMFYMSMNYENISYTTMGALFVVFSALEGVALTPLLAQYTMSSVFYVFGIASAMFIVMALYGWLTNSDLSSMGNILFMGLVGLVIANIVNMFVRSSSFSLGIAVIGVAIFAMLIAYDIQKLKNYSQQVLASPEDAGKFALMGALGLYLNLINIFIYLLRIFGDQRKK